MTLPSLECLLSFAQESAFVAGRRTLAYFGTNARVERKPDGSVVTQADLEAEDVLRRMIRKAFPGHTILGEERGEDLGEKPVRWILDPVDGTESFVRGVPLFGTLVGVELCGEPVVGVIYLPALDEMIAAAQGKGCTWNGRPCAVSERAQLSEALLVMTDQTDAEGRSPNFSRLVERTSVQRTWGDCYGYSLVATGRAEIALDASVSIWDTAALLPIIEEAGGRMTDWTGYRTISGGNALASNGWVHEEALSLLGA